MAGVNAQLFTDMATTFEAFSRDPEALKATISKSPPSLDEGIRSLAVQRPFLRDLAAFSEDLRGRDARAARRPAHDQPARCERAPRCCGAPWQLNERTEEVLVALNDLVRAPDDQPGAAGA